MSNDWQTVTVLRKKPLKPSAMKTEKVSFREMGSFSVWETIQAMRQLLNDAT